MKLFAFLASFFFSYYSIGQTTFWLDSIIVHPSNPTTNDSIEISVYGKFANTGIALTNISLEIDSEIIMLDFYTSDCFGFNILIPFDTTINIGNLSSGNYTLEWRGIIDTNTIDSNCNILSVPYLFDSIFVPISIIPSGINTIKSFNEINVFPNPSTGIFEINCDIKQDEIITFIIYDLLGKNVNEYSLTSMKNIIDLDKVKWKKGVYYYHILAANKVIDSGKLVIF